MVGGLPARFSYWVLYRRHLATLLGTTRTLLLTIGQWLSRRSQPRVKLH
jgi:NADH dehydrogenase